MSAVRRSPLPGLVTTVIALLAACDSGSPTAPSGTATLPTLPPSAAGGAPAVAPPPAVGGGAGSVNPATPPAAATG
ncbi:MAG TPA: hypothetical protein VJV78_35680, partial [Polyangiales bacterium]|nr:hypothetical protein [Polyangiales bacterium]